MTNDAASAEIETTPHAWATTLLFWPIVLALAGVLLRYLGYGLAAPHPTPMGYIAATCVWDCTWYGDVALHGYQAHPETLNFGGPAGIANWAFFPLYPLLIGVLHMTTGATPPLLGAIVSPLLTLAAVLASWPLFNGDRRAYLLLAAFLLAGPFSFYFSVLYSESLFLLLTVAAFVALQRRSYLAAGFAGALLSATRTVGVLFVFAMLVEAAVELGRRARREIWCRPDIVLGVVLVPLGLVAFMAWLYLVTDDALAFLHIQRGWDRVLVNPLGAIWGGLTSPVGQVRDAPFLAIAALVGLALCCALAVRREWGQAVFCTLALLLALTSGLESMIRFIVALAPLGIVLCQLLAQRRWLFWLSLVAFLALSVEGSLLWVQQRGALM